MEFIFKSFGDLNTAQLFEIYKLRSEIFIVEQNCAYQDVDDIDKVALHVLLMASGSLAAYARIIPPGISHPEPAIGRVVVKKNFRGQDFGKALMKESIKQLHKLYKKQDIVIAAQSYLIKFYSDLGFKTEGAGYLEDNIPHTQMRLSAANSLQQ